MKKTISTILLLILLISITGKEAFANNNNKEVVSLTYETNEKFVINENTCGYWYTDYEGKDFFYYDVEKVIFGKIKCYTVSYSDGTSKRYDFKTVNRVDGYYDNNNELFRYSIITNQEEEHWSKGNNYVTVSYEGATCQIPILVVGYTGWKNESGNTYYYKNGKTIKKLQKINGKFYYFDNTGALQKGWIKDKKTMYADINTGVLSTGWKKINNKWYLFRYADASMITGWAKSANKWYYLNSNGVMKTGWLKYKGKWYYLNPSGDMAVGWKKVSGKWYYLNPSGDMTIGWKKVSGKWYYFEYSGAMLANTTRRIGSKNYNFNSSGACTNPY